MTNMKGKIFEIDLEKKRKKEITHLKQKIPRVSPLSRLPTLGFTPLANNK